MNDVDSNALPPGWEMKYDRRSGKHYYMNYLTKMTSWEDPRMKSKPQGTPQHYPVDFVTQQSGHGSPYHVYPYPSPVPLQHAFQNSSVPNSNLQTSFSPKALPKQITELGGRSYGSPLSGGSPVLGRGINLTPKGSPQAGRISYLSNKLQDTTISLQNDVEASVAKISSMFPTVSETHIKILLKKYYNREAVVISALQVEKHPISTPGPFSTPPPGVSRLQAVAAGVYAGMHLARGASPTPPFGSSPRGSPPLRPQSGASGGSPHFAPQSSPKMKLRYLKSLFPKAEETLILDLLANEENNVQKTSDTLIAMGFAKKDPAQPKVKVVKDKEVEQPKPTTPKVVTPPRLKSVQEKQELKVALQTKYSSIPERVVAIALESVGWSEERAEQILSAVVQEDAINKKPKESEQPPKKDVDPLMNIDLSSRNKVDALASLTPPTHVAPQLNGSSPDIESPPEIKSNSDKVNRRFKNKKEPLKKFENSSSDKDSSYRSPYLRKAKGPDPCLAKGAQDGLLLVDYITWNGANPDLKSSVKISAMGPSKSCDVVSRATSVGPKKDYCKGPAIIAKGSIYQMANNLPQMKVGGE